MSVYLGVDFHTRTQTVCWCDTTDGLIRQRTLDHEHDDVCGFYAQFAVPATVGLEATGYARWFHRLLESLAVQVQHQFAGHGGNGHGGVLFSCDQPEIEVAQVVVGFDPHGPMSRFHQEMAEEPVTLFRDVPHTHGVATGKFAGVEAAIGGDAPRALKSRDRFQRVSDGQGSK